MVSEGATAGSHCPTCGIAVPPGYPRCPRCHAALPVAQRPLVAASRTAAAVKGGTAVDSPSRLPLLIAGGVLLVAAVVVIVLVARGGSETSEESSASDDTSGEQLPAAGNATTQVVAPALTAETTTEASQLEQQLTAIDEFEASLSQKRLWSTVRVNDMEPDVVTVQSGSCESEEMATTLAASESKLKQVGFNTLRCLAKHGALVFERPL